MKDLVSMGAKSMKASDAGGIRHRGFTLIELLVAMVIASIVMAAVFSIYAGLTRSYTTQNAAADVQQTMRAGINLMVDDIMMAGFDKSGKGIAGFEVANSTSMRFTSDRNENEGIDNLDYEDITYTYDTSDPQNPCLRQILYEGEAEEENEVLIENVSELSFDYLDGDGNSLGDPVLSTDLDDIGTVVIKLTVREKVGREKAVDQTYTTQVRCRNIGI